MKTDWINRHLLKKIYGNKLSASPAVAALEQYCRFVRDWDSDHHSLFAEIEEYDRLSDEAFDSEKPEDKEKRERVLEMSVDEPWRARDAMRPLREALCRGDVKFFADLAKAIEKRSNPKFTHALILSEYISQGRPPFTIEELRAVLQKTGQKGANVPRIVKDQLGIDSKSDPWLITFEKTGPKAKRR